MAPANAGGLQVLSIIAGKYGAYSFGSAKYVQRHRQMGVGDVLRPTFDQAGGFDVVYHATQGAR